MKTNRSRSMPPSLSRRQSNGFTLLELMIVVAIVAILAGIAYASYQDQIIKSRRAAAANCLQERAQFMERYYTTHLTYNNPNNPPVIAQCDAEVSPHYQVGFSAAPTPKAFTLQAVPVPGSAQERRDTKCGTLTLASTGTRGVSGTAASTPSECW